MSDGLFLFETGSLAPNVTISLADFYLWAIDGGLKYRGFALNVELYFRWLNGFVADGPLLPIESSDGWVCGSGGPRPGAEPGRVAL